MQGSVGQALRDARLEKKLTIGEVAHATKIRGSRISDLEDDDYTHFPNIAYARSFLVLYAKYLGVDISKYPTVEVGSTVGLGDYQYLRSDEVATPQRARPDLSAPPEKPRWLIVFFVILAFALFGALVGWYAMNLRRLGSVENLVEKNAGTQPAPTATPTPKATPTPVQTPASTPAPTPPRAATQPQEKVLPAIPVATPSPEPEIRRAIPVAKAATPEPVAAAEPVTPAIPASIAAATPAAEREISIRSTKKIKIRVEKDAPNTPSLYFGNVNPLMRPLIFQGKYFWIKTSEPDALQVTVNGQPVSGTDAGVMIEGVQGL